MVSVFFNLSLDGEDLTVRNDWSGTYFESRLVEGIQETSTLLYNSAEFYLAKTHLYIVL